MRKIIDGNINLANLHLTELFDLSDVEVTGDFYCNGNDLSNLTGAPKTVNGSFYCSDTSLTSLKGAPHTVGGDFRCHRNNLTSLEGAPETVGGDFYCDGNNITSLEGIPKTIGGFFCINKSLINKFPEVYIRSLCEIKGGIVYYD